MGLFLFRSELDQLSLLGRILFSLTRAPVFVEYKRGHTAGARNGWKGGEEEA